jgi:hypothetical protein
MNEINSAIAERALAGEWLTEAELTELDSVDVLSLGMLADEVRRARVGVEVTYVRVLEIEPTPFDPDATAARARRAGEVRITRPADSLPATLDLVRAIRQALGGDRRLSVSSLADVVDARWAPLPDVLCALAEAGLDLVAEAPVDRVEPADVAAVTGAGLALGALSVQRHAEGDRVLAIGRFREAVTAAGRAVACAPLAREQSAAAPTTGYHDVRLVALARLALPDVPVIQVDWRQYGPKLAQVALTFGANRLDCVPVDDDPALGRRRSRVEEVRRNIEAAGFTPVEWSGR